MENPWNSLEIVKMIISALTPIIGGIIAWRLSKISKKVEKKQWTDQKIIEKRLEIYEDVVPKLNDLYCFYQKVGAWKSITPPRVIQIKRELDKAFHINNYLFKNDVLIIYNDFIDACFETYTGSGQGAKIIAEFQERKKYAAEWEGEWDALFSVSKEANTNETANKYKLLLQSFRNELGLK